MSWSSPEPIDGYRHHCGHWLSLSADRTKKLDQQTFLMVEASVPGPTPTLTGAFVSTGIAVRATHDPRGLALFE